MHCKHTVLNIVVCLNGKPCLFSSCQGSSPAQMELLAKHNPNRPVFVEGPFPQWLRKTYSGLINCPLRKRWRSHTIQRGVSTTLFSWTWTSNDYLLSLPHTYNYLWPAGQIGSFDVEDVDEGASFAMCMTSRGEQATLNQWISGLQETNPTQFRLEAEPRERHILSLDTGTDRGEMKKQGPGQRDRQSQILLWRRDIAVARE
ncbi:evolutionarily conserved signaling intermediate in Toll pathway, mitochondrial-like [Coregonus clupeaformis]|uniref:evolutionarily conserved signaling intermediate in Toll pathway, mitochondrial-like n=1 Tax=Coregonus clupeaformis TaxID=59861 RepID=UPI001E1C66FE|nr:evolutionarily conserved signaling intermediate in Toll pathway, mitochondrial-like [Coregonus clupeaformis]